MKTLASLLAGGLLSAASLSAAPRTTRFHGTVRGAITIAGNTLGLSKPLGKMGPGRPTASGRSAERSCRTSVGELALPKAAGPPLCPRT
jgi:hypothetical protein